MNNRLSDLPRNLLIWYRANARKLPWRITTQERELGHRPDPYRVWLSEIMLQQTPVKHAIPYFHKFMESWPTIGELALATDDEIMSAWAGLGYYARARNLLKTARAIDLLGHFPEQPSELRKFPGIGEYTSKAIASIAFEKPYVAVDTNVERVFSRILALNQEWKEAKRIIRETSAQLIPTDLPSEFSQALMDLGANICTPKQPKCSLCPIRIFCSAQKNDDMESYPRKPIKALRPKRYGAVFVLIDGNHVFLERRDQSGLLGGMLGFPCTEWSTNMNSPPSKQMYTLAKANWQYLSDVQHVFTHFSLTLAVYTGKLLGVRPSGIWVSFENVNGLPTLFKKVLNAVTPCLR